VSIDTSFSPERCPEHNIVGFVGKEECQVNENAPMLETDLTQNQYFNLKKT
jgi:hypothetical protein